VKICLGCKLAKPLRAEHWHGRQRRSGWYWSARCKECVNAKRRGVAVPRSAEHRALDQRRHLIRGRALTRLSRLVPELYADLLAEETSKAEADDDDGWMSGR
jgi:hypothetical protein